MLREQIGVLLAAVVVSFVLTSLMAGLRSEKGVQRLGYDLPSALYPNRPGEASNRFRVSVAVKEDFERIEMHTYWLASKPTPNLTASPPNPTTETIDTLLTMTSPWASQDLPLEVAVEYRGSAATLQLYDFSTALRLAGVDVEETPTCFAFLLYRNSSIALYLEGYSDFFPLPGKTISLLRLARKGSAEEFARAAGGTSKETLRDAPRYGVWTVDRPRRSEILELSVLLTDDAALHLQAEWGKTSEKLQVTSMILDGKQSSTWWSFA